MGKSREQNQHLLFACTVLDSGRLDKTSLQAMIKQVDNWDVFYRQLELDGLAPLFYQHCRNLKLTLPNKQDTLLKSLVLRHKAIAKARYQALEEFSQAMNEAGIGWYALKGLALAQILYEDESLRPMRDFDVLVPKDRLVAVAGIMRKLGYALPEEQPSQFMRDSHQLPNAEKKVNGFTVSIEIHHNAIGRDSKGSMLYEDIKITESFKWREIEIQTLGKLEMLHQVSRHLEAVHPGGRLKLINVLDVIGFSEKYFDQIDWSKADAQYPHISNTLACLHMVSPLSDELQARLKAIKYLPISKHFNEVAEIMQPIKSVLTSSQSRAKKVTDLVAPPDWWLHLYYSVPPNRSLFFTKAFSHPFSLLKWAMRRAYSYTRGG